MNTMQTKEIKDFYNQSLQKSSNVYEQDRWFSSSQARAGYHSTRSAVLRYALPLLNNESDILELGPGPGTWTKILLQKAPQARFDLVDISEEMLSQARTNLGNQENISYITSDILDFSPQKQYDFFFSSRIIEYVPQKDQAVKTIAASLRSGAYGYIVTKTPQQKRFFGTAITSPVHASQIPGDELAELFEKHHCRILKKVHVTAVFPGLRSGLADRILTSLSRILPFRLSNIVSESYALVFQKQ